MSKVLIKRRKDAMTAKTKTPLRAKPGTRVEQLPSLARGVKLPNGYTPAYFRKRKTLAVLRAVDSSHYLIFNTSTGEKMQVNTTKEASQTMSAIRRGQKKFPKTK